jgi:hypothetical protein
LQTFGEIELAQHGGQFALLCASPAKAGDAHRKSAASGSIVGRGMFIAIPSGRKMAGWCGARR